MSLANKQQTNHEETPSPEIISDLNKALSHHQNGDLKEAERLYKKALSKSNHQTDIAIMVAIFYQQIGRHKYVITLLKKVLLKSPHHVKANHIIGKSYLENEQYEKALPHLNEAQTLDITNAEVSYKLGVCWHRLGQLAKVLPLYKQAMADKDALAEGDKQQLYNSIADILVSTNQKQEAIEYLEEAVTEKIANYGTLIRLIVARGESAKQSLQHAINAILTDPERNEAKALFARSCELGCLPPLANQQMKNIILSCLNSPRVNHQSLTLPWVLNFFLLADKKKTEQLLDAENYEAFTNILESEGTRELFYDEYFFKGLKSIRANRTNLERLYTFFRKNYLLKVQNNEQLTDNDLSLMGAMAQQCFLNEYIFNITDEEQFFIEQTKEKLENLSVFEPKHHGLILLFAAYEPLISLSTQQTIAKIKNIPPLEEVVTQQISEPLTEKRLQNTIKSLGSLKQGNLKNEVSQNVRTQYEENPYPRWLTESMFAPLHTKAIDKTYQQKLSVLIAGSGTGKQILSTYNYYPNAKFTAIDISKASLAYAKRKLIDYKLDKNVELYHCDILEAEKLNQTYDYIECCGVLHHMENPLEGLKTLTRMLKPGGKIKLALYSTLARQPIFNARAFIEEQGFKPTPAGIRACRKFMIEENFKGKLDFPLAQWRDFNTLSECRDLLFHVQEKCYDLHEINQLLIQSGLAFEGFFTDNKVTKAFEEKFPNEQQSTDLECWAEFEQTYPNTFAGMYQFMAIKQ